MFLKFVLQLYFFHKKHKTWDTTTHVRWEALLKKQAVEYRENALKLEGLMIKVGQFLSTRADIMPDVFIKELADLIDKVPPVPTDISKKILEKEWGQSLDSHLSYISDKPVASASIGEVYKGTLLNGQDVAIKIQRHNISKIIHTDFKALRIVLWITRKFTILGKELNTDALYQEVVSIIGNELNYYKELKNGQYFQRRFHDSTDYYIPQFYEEYSTGKVLVMEWIEGRKVTDIPFLNKHNINRKVAARKLFQFFVDQLFDYGMFHADPHQGNILITSKGTIVIIDFGMVGEISKEDAQHIRQMIQGFILDDYELVITQLKELGFLLPHANKHKLQTLLKTYSDMYIEKKIHQLDEKLVEDIFQDLKQIVRDQPIQLPAEFAFLGRAASIGLGVLTIIDPHIDFMALGKPVVREWLDKDEERSGNIKWHFIKESVKPLFALPRNLNEWLLNGPEFKRRSEELLQYQRFDHHRYLFMMVMAYVSLLVTLAFYFISIIIGNNQLQFMTLPLTGLTFTLCLITTFLHKRWVNNMKQSHKG
jgi:predicted unusual protein kinase regulating ubiquinone biosynthesis (AarF/ABC1/UbiB family)